MAFGSIFRVVSLVLLGSVLGHIASPASAQDVPSSTTVGVSATRNSDPGTIRGRIVDANTGEPVIGVSIRVEESGRTTQTRPEGTFVIERVAAGTATISMQRIGYTPRVERVQVTSGETTRLDVELQPAALDIAGLVVTGVGRQRDASDTYQPTTVLEGAELRRRLGTSVAATLAGQPGISERYNGPAAAQPVIRGLGGDRVLLLEDGNRTGDIASTGGDHAVTIEPLTTERVEVVRGPAGLLYGSNALGGVINVVRDEVPRTLPDRPTGSISLQAESVNRGVAGGGSILGSIGSVALRGELSGRHAGDTRTPLGDLPSTDLDGYNGSVGISHVSPGAMFGVAVRDYSLRYGVPGTFEGETIPGAHEGGIGIDLRRTVVRVDGELTSGLGPFRSIQASGNYVRYEQQELERMGDIEFVGTEFGQLTGTGRVVAHHEHEPAGQRLEGAVGLWTLWKDFSAAGSNTGSRPAEQYAIAGFGYEELGLGRVRLQAGARYDWTRINPLDTFSSPLLQDVRTRDFGAFSGSFATLFDISERLTIGASVARSFRTPAIEELFSDGPHLASYSFEVGNPSLESEFGLGTDLFVRVTGRKAHGEATVFRNHVQDFIYYAPTGELDPRSQRYPVYRATQGSALLWGAEGEAEWELLTGLVLGGQASYVRATLESDNSPLPAIPPLRGSARLRFERLGYFAGVEIESAAAQRRIGEFETPTDGFTVLGAHAGVRWNWGSRLHTVTLDMTNLTDQVWRDHLSRIREVAPQPGRNIRLLYRVDI